MNSGDEVLAQYSNNNVKTFYKECINRNFKSNTFKKAISTSNPVVENKKYTISSEKKVENKLVDHSGYDYNYFNGKNHLVRECMLMKKEKRLEKVKDEAYYSQKIEALRAESKNISLAAKGVDVAAGTYQIW